MPGCGLPVSLLDKEIARAIAVRSGGTDGYLALLGDKRLLFSDSGDSFIMYAVQGLSWIAMGDPVGKPEERAELAWKFKEICDLHGGRPVFYEISREGLSDYADVGLSFLKLGEKGRAPLSGTSWGLFFSGMESISTIFRVCEPTRKNSSRSGNRGTWHRREDWPFPPYCLTLPQSFPAASRG
jgi:hypothetical protein